MAIDNEAAVYLKPWLVRTLEPICDAEPGALGEYILALLKHNAPEADLRQELSAQLEEFLEKETQPFIQTLFTALRTKSYMPYAAPSPPTSPSGPSSSIADNGIPIPLDLVTPSEPSPDRRRKRSLEQDERDHRPPKGPRLHGDGQFQRFGGRPEQGGWGRGERGGRMNIPGRADFMDGGMDLGVDAGMGGGMMMNGGRGSYRPPERSRGICRDYHNNGYCARGAFCKFSHGEDAVVPDQLFPMGGLPGFNPMMPFPIMQQNTQYNPHERMDMRPMPGGMGSGRLPSARPPIIPRDPNMNGSYARKAGELPVIQDLTPRLSQDEPSPAFPVAMNGAAPFEEPISRATPIKHDIDMSLPANPMAGQRGGSRPRGGGPRGAFSAAESIRPERRNDKTLVVEKIPEDKLSLGSINDWFKKFGTVTNVAVDPTTSKALVSFSDHKEAFAAWRSEEAVFGNRFVKTFWHRPMEGHGHKGTRMLAASADLVAKVASKETAPTPSPAPPAETPRPSPSTFVRKSTLSSTPVSALAAKQQLLEQQIAEQKSLMTQLATASPEAKKTIMARLRKLNEEMKPKSTPVPTAASTSDKPSRGTTPRTDDQVTSERERLDKELEFHSAVEGEVDETDELKARLAKLKAEAASLGIGEGAQESAPAFNGGFRGFRGRGRARARGFYRGGMRGGPPPRASMKLDNRPKKLLVKGASVDSLQGVRDWYETTGQVDSIETTEEGDFLVSFKSRSAAEQGYAKGTSIPTVGSVQVSWFAAQTPAPARSAVATTEANSVENTDKTGLSSEHTHDRAPSPGPGHDDHVHEEDIAVAGWGGGDGEDDFGMM